MPDIKFPRLKRPKKKHAAAPDLSSSEPRDLFLGLAAGVGSGGRVLEIGTLRSLEQPTHWLRYFPHVARENYVMADIEPGLDVDVVEDIHRLPAAWSSSFDAVIAGAVFEHLERPWHAAREVARVLKPGGHCYIATHQTFPLHNYPGDFFRFSTEALSLIFEDAGLTVLKAGYETRVALLMPSALVPRLSLRAWNRVFPSYLGVHLCATKGSAANGS